MLGFDIAAALRAARELANLHPSLAVVSLAIEFAVGCGILLKIICIIDLMLVKHVDERRRVIAGLPPRPKRRFRFLHPLRGLIRFAARRTIESAPERSLESRRSPEPSTNRPAA